MKIVCPNFAPILFRLTGDLFSSFQQFPFFLKICCILAVNFRQFKFCCILAVKSAVWRPLSGVRDRRALVSSWHFTEIQKIAKKQFSSWHFTEIQKIAKKQFSW
jgi:hypothetical protein